MIQIIDGQNVKKAIIPKTTGFGFGSGHIPISARKIINNKGPEPSINRLQPILLSNESKYFRFAIKNTKRLGKDM
jgi:hypothetical protein